MIGQESIQGTYGPIARSHRDLHLFMSVILASQPWIHDVSCVKIPWQMEEVSFKGGTTPKIGVMWDDGVVKLQPPMRRALQMAVDRIFNANFEVVEYQAYKAAENWDILVGYPDSVYAYVIETAVFYGWWREGSQCSRKDWRAITSTHPVDSQPKLRITQRISTHRSKQTINVTNKYVE